MVTCEDEVFICEDEVISLCGSADEVIISAKQLANKIAGCF